jgi:hypothetical protein
MTNCDDSQRDLEALVARVNPSPAFVAAVRTRVAEDAERRSHRAAFVWALGGLLCLASLVWALAARRPVAGSVPAATTVSAALAAPSVPPELALTQPRARPDRAHGSRAVRLDATPAPAEAAAANGEAGDSRVLVPDDQRIALVNLLQRLHLGRATVPAGVVPAYDKDGLLVPPELIVIAPLPDPVLLDPDDKGATVDPKGPAKDKQ